MTDVFVSYRQRDAGGWAGRIFDRLSAHFGRDRVHSEPTASTPGAVVVVIGPDWTAAADPDEGTLVTDPGDEGYRQLATALRAGSAAVPVLVDGAAMPSAQVLLPGMKPLAEATPIVVGSMSFEEDVGRLIAEVEHELRGPEPPAPVAAPAPARRGILAVAIALVLLIMGLVFALVFATGVETTGSAPVEFLLRA